MVTRQRSYHAGSCFFLLASLSSVVLTASRVSDWSAPTAHHCKS